MSDARKIEYVPLDDLTADPRNPKNHDVETIDASVGRFGIVDLIVVDGRTGYIVSGHGRTKTLQAMRDRGESAPEGVKVAKDGTWLVPVSSGWSSRSDSEAAAALIAMNRTTELGGWVDDALLDLLDDLSVNDEGLVGVGFTEEDRAALEHLEYAVEVHGPRDLDALHESVGDPTEEDTYERVVLVLPPELAERLKAAVGFDAAAQAKAASAWLDYLAESGQ